MVPSSIRFAALAAVACVIVLIVGCSGAGTAASDAADRRSVVVAEYADTALTLDAFETRYTRSTEGDPTDDSLGAYQDFLERYVNFRLRVRAAREAGMDTLPAVRNDVADYRRQMARPTLLKNEVMEPILRELYDRKQEQVKARHLLIRVDPNAAPEDTLAAYGKVQSLKDSLETGASFAALARAYSEDPSASQQGRRGYEGDLGWLTGGQVVAPFEDRMYELPEGAVSDVFRTRFGYHILKVEGRRERPQPKRVAHILLRPDGRTPADSAAARQTADSLLTALSDGAPFDSLARAYSDDPRSAGKGGELGLIQPGQPLPDAFRDSLSALDAPGDVSGVVSTRFGYHILKVLEIEERASFAEARSSLQEEAARLPRVDRQEAAFAREVQAEHGLSVDTTALRTVGGTGIDSLGRTLIPLARKAEGDTTLAVLGDSTYTLRRLARYTLRADGASRQTVGEVLDGFLTERAIDYAAGRLESRDAEFARLMDEYREGLLLFQYMQDSVWTVAASDTAALRTWYREHRDTYRMPARVRTVVFHAPHDSVLTPYADDRAAGTPIDDLVARAAADSLVRPDTVFVTDDADGAFANALNVTNGTAVGPMTHEGGALFYIRDADLPARPKTFAEAKSDVIQEYQDAYEEETVNTLRSRYNVRTYPGRLEYAFSGERPSANDRTAPQP